MRDDGSTLTGRAPAAMVKLLGVLVDVLRRAEGGLRALADLAGRVASTRFPGSAGRRQAAHPLVQRTSQMLGADLPLVAAPGTGRVVACDECGVDLLVRGLRVHYTWDRLIATWERLLANHTLSVDELGGGHDAVGIVSLFSRLQPDTLVTVPGDGLLLLREPSGTPVHQYADMSRPVVWSPVRHLTHGG